MKAIKNIKDVRQQMNGLQRKGGTVDLPIKEVTAA